MYIVSVLIAHRCSLEKGRSHSLALLVLLVYKDRSLAALNSILVFVDVLGLKMSLVIIEVPTKEEHDCYDFQGIERESKHLQVNFCVLLRVCTSITGMFSSSVNYVF